MRVNLYNLHFLFFLFFFSTKQISFPFIHFSIVPIKYIQKKTKIFLSFHFSTPPDSKNNG